MGKHVNLWVPEIGMSCSIWWSRDAPGLLLQNNQLTCTAFGSSWCGDLLGWLKPGSFVLDFRMLKVCGRSVLQRARICLGSLQLGSCCTEFKRKLIGAAVAVEIIKRNDLYLPKFFLRYRTVSGVHWDSWLLLVHANSLSNLFITAAHFWSFLKVSWTKCAS